MGFWIAFIVSVFVYFMVEVQCKNVCLNIY